MTVRVYVPTTLAGLAALVDAGELPGPFVAHAVTDAVRAEWADSSEEEWEYEALCLAADDCADLWEEVPAERRRRVVVALDVPAATTADDDDPTLVRVTDAAPLRWVAAVHADLSAADAAADDDLCWFAASEVDQLLGT